MSTEVKQDSVTAEFSSFLSCKEKTTLEVEAIVIKMNSPLVVNSQKDHDLCLTLTTSLEENTSPLLVKYKSGFKATETRLKIESFMLQKYNDMDIKALPIIAFNANEAKTLENHVWDNISHKVVPNDYNINYGLFGVLALIVIFFAIAVKKVDKGNYKIKWTPEEARKPIDDARSKIIEILTKNDKTD